mmetsp:Transcript_42454/g.83432  ORF Transcript_42454/g.83432 Transcript_42454/m.83432 type:complete len:264 (-) Transcript_42454:521-1312(-)|eukprot:CAMPEP_0194317108 /NCGR_PEP_ID=MMETSP0171-20130528/13857_1 /TAXON_ID=218684 /ORGANISM="Corethron pennatum, Strain L29A3" /LENGTH=263 /DNA_ID=CAMNT_0039073583 /DNA_START=154 /DNA_END=945 /DNA_ORIENTATION=+
MFRKASDMWEAGSPLPDGGPLPDEDLLGLETEEGLSSPLGSPRGGADLSTKPVPDLGPDLVPGSVPTVAACSIFTSAFLRYTAAIDSNPIQTKAVTSAVITGGGDLIAQCIEGKIHFDLKRVASFALAGGLYVGPFIHMWFSYLFRFGSFLSDRKVIKSRAANTLLLVAIDQSIGAVVFFVPYFFVFDYLRSWVYGTPYFFNNSMRKMDNDMWDILKMSWRIFPFANYLSFTFVPPQMRVLASNVIGVFWNAYLCAKLSSTRR